MLLLQMLKIIKIGRASCRERKSLRMKRWRPRAKGRAASIIKPFSKVTIVVEERTKTKKEIK